MRNKTPITDAFDAMRAEIARLAAELAAARAVPADVDTAIIEAVEAACRVTSAEQASHLNRNNAEIADAKRDYSEQDKILRATIAGAIAEARQPATVGGLLATAPVDLSGHPGSLWKQAIEWCDCGTWFRIAPGKSESGAPTLVLSTWRDGWHYEDENPMSIDLCVYGLPARLVPATEADADPMATRGPLPKGG